MATHSTASVRIQIEAALAERIPSALTLQRNIVRPVTPTNIDEIDKLLHGGLPVGDVSEIVGPESSGRTSLALAFVAGITQAGKVCAWIDVSNALHPESVAAIGVDLSRMFWVRCGVLSPEPRQSSPPECAFPEKYTMPPTAKKGLHGGGFGPHPRTEVIGPHPRTEVKGLSAAVGDLLSSAASVCVEPACAGQGRKQRPQRDDYEQQPERLQRKRSIPAGQPWQRLDQALRVTDLLLQAGGFASIVLDMGSIKPEHALRVPLATWFRFRAAAERTQLNFLLLTQHACAKNSAALVLRLDEAKDEMEGQCNPLAKDAKELTIFTGMERRAGLDLQRFTASPENVVAPRKPPHSIGTTAWQSRTAWTGRG